MRGGNTLIVVLAISLLLASQVYILLTFSSGGFRHTEKVTAHVRAIYVGESAFARTLARLKGAQWKDRWFKAAPIRESTVSLSDGSYSSYVADGSADPARKLVDVWIEARYDTSLVVMYWNVLYVDDTLDFTAQVYPHFFTFLGGQEATPFNGPINPALTLVQDMMNVQRTNGPAALSLVSEIESLLPFSSVATRLNIPAPANQALDRTVPFGQPTVPQATYMTQVQGEIGTPPSPAPRPTPTPVPAPVPAPTATPSPLPSGLPLPNLLASMFPSPNAAPFNNGNPQGILAVLDRAFADAGLAKPSLLESSLGLANFDGDATNYWQTARNRFNNPTNGRLQDYQIRESIAKLLEALVKAQVNAGADPQVNVAAPSRRIIDALLQYARDVTGNAGLALPSYSASDVLNGFRDNILNSMGTLP